jgi:redox-sensitive bicupin YhaK (pirin superfamily)
MTGKSPRPYGRGEYGNPTEAKFMIEARPFAALGKFRNDWLESYFHFSFAEYHDPRRMGVGSLRVWNDDTIKPGTGFDMHPHRDMEIITCMRSGAITHEDNAGNRGRTGAGEVQVMSAGTGIVHSEFNLETGDTTLVQIWIVPAETGVSPHWETRAFPQVEAAGSLCVLASGRANDDGALPIHQDAAVIATALTAGQRVSHGLAAGRFAYLVPTVGAVTVNGVRIDTRDGAAIADETQIVIEALEDAEIVLVDTV